MKHILFALVLPLCLACSSYAAMAQNASPLIAAENTTLEQSMAQAAIFMEQGKAKEAAEIYAALTTRYPDRGDLFLAQARAALAAGDAAQALPLYDSLVAVNPDSAELRLEAARAHLAAGNKSAALRLGGQALEEYEKARLQVHGAVRVGLVYDSNANQGPYSDTLSLGVWDNVNIPNIEKKESLAAYLGANLDLGWRLGVTSPWWVVGDAQGYWRGNGNDNLKALKSRELQWGRTAAGLRFLDEKNMLDLRFKAEIFDYEFITNVTALGAELRYARALTPWLQLIADAGLESRAYNNKGYPRNGAFGRAGGYARFLFGDAGHEFLIGAGYVGASANRTDYAYDGWQGLARFTFKLPYGFTLSPSLSFTQELYKGPGTALETRNRKDERLRIGADISYAVTESWSIEAAYYYTNTFSTCNLYKNDQHMVSLGVAWKF